MLRRLGPTEIWIRTPGIRSIQLRIMTACPIVRILVFIEHAEQVSAFRRSCVLLFQVNSIMLIW